MDEKSEIFLFDKNPRFLENTLFQTARDVGRARIIGGRDLASVALYYSLFWEGGVGEIMPPLTPDPGVKITRKIPSKAAPVLP